MKGILLTLLGFYFLFGAAYELVKGASPVVVVLAFLLALLTLGWARSVRA